MNPDQNNQPEQPEQPQPQTFEAPQPVAQNAPVTPTPAANPFGAAPVSSEAPVSTPFAQPGMAPASNPAPQPPKKSNKKLIIILSAVVGGLILLAGAAVAAYFIFFSVSKEDYQQAYDQIKVVNEKANNASDISDDTATSDSVDKFKTSYNEFKDSSAKLKDLRAIRLDGTVHEKFVAYDKKVGAYTAFMDSFIPSIEQYIKISTKVNDITTSASTTAYYEEVIAILDDAKDVPDPTVKALLDKYKEAYKEMLPQVKIYNTSTSTSAQRSAAITKLSATAKDLTAAAKTFKDDIEAKRDDLTPKTQFEALKQAVSAKLNK